MNENNTVRYIPSEKGIQGEKTNQLGYRLGLEAAVLGAVWVRRVMCKEALRIGSVNVTITIILLLFDISDKPHRFAIRIQKTEFNWVQK